MDLGAPFGKSPVDFDRIAGGVFAGIIHGGSHGHGQRDLILYLLQAPAAFVQIIIDRFHLFAGTAGEV